jgi:diadenylate cyclase
MLESIWNFFQAVWRSGVEILILTVVFYWAYRLFRRSPAVPILIGAVVLVVGLWLIATLLNLVVIGWIVRGLSVLMIFSAVVIFQPEIRRVLGEIGSHRFFTAPFQKKETIELIVDSVFELASKGFGALIALEREISLKPLRSTGVDIDCVFSKELVLTVFHPKTVLHDGGMIIQDDRITAAACIFPLTQREDLDRNLGLRHRAALGLTEESDAIVVVVSEETGQVSICHDGTIDRNLNVDNFRRRLNQLLLLEKYEKSDPE